MCFLCYSVNTFNHKSPYAEHSCYRYSRENNAAVFVSVITTAVVMCRVTLCCVRMLQIPEALFVIFAVIELMICHCTVSAEPH